MPNLAVSIIVVGDEILTGFVADTNSGWLAGRLQALGVPLDRIVTVGDDIAAIAEALTGELARPRPRVVLTSGGIGSTPDDVTMEAVAASLGHSMTTHPDLDARISASIERSAVTGAPVAAEHARSMRKMARVPDGSYVLAGAEGIAPGVAVDVDGGSRAGGATVVVLPGIPSELRRLTTTSVEPALLAGRGHPQHVVELRHGYPESTLNPALERLLAEYPDVHVGSYPGRECTVRLKGPEDRVEQAAVVVRDYLDELDRQPFADRLRAAWQSRWD